MAEDVNIKYGRVEVKPERMQSYVKQQELNSYVCAKLTHFIRRNQPRGVEISVGGVKVPSWFL